MHKCLWCRSNVTDLGCAVKGTDGQTYHLHPACLITYRAIKKKGATGPDLVEDKSNKPADKKR